MQRFKFLATVVVTAMITSLFWIVVYNGAALTSSASTSTANTVADLPPGKAVTATLEGPAQLVVAPSGLAIPVAGTSARDLVDTYTQSRSGGAPASASALRRPEGFVLSWACSNGSRSAKMGWAKAR